MHTLKLCRIWLPCGTNEGSPTGPLTPGTSSATGIQGAFGRRPSRDGATHYIRHRMRNFGALRPPGSLFRMACLRGAKIHSLSNAINEGSLAESLGSFRQYTFFGTTTELGRRSCGDYR